MKKLPHERLRKYSEDGVEIPPPYSDVWNVLADEIERCYIPRPRFEDGEPLQFGDEVEWADYCTRKITEFAFSNDGKVAVSCAGDGMGMNDMMVPCGYLKRPTPKVLDADGVPTKNGDRVYPIKQNVYSDADGYIVDHVEIDDGVNSPRVYFIDDVGMSWMKASELTHEKPVFDAEGVRYVRGEKVWSLAGIEYIVEEIIDADHIRTRFPDSEKAHASFTSRTLTHREPDSQQRINDDAEKLVRQLAEHYKINDTVWTSSSMMSPTLLESIYSLLERQRSLIERGA